MCLECMQRISLLLTVLSVFGSFAVAFFAYKNLKALYTLKKCEIDLTLREERKEFFEEVSDMLAGINNGIKSYMAARGNKFDFEQRKVRTLERKASYSLDRDSQKIFSEIIQYIFDTIGDYGKARNTSPDGDQYMHPISQEQYDLRGKALKNLEKLETKYLCVESLYPKRSSWWRYE